MIAKKSVKKEGEKKMKNIKVETLNTEDATYFQQFYTKHTVVGYMKVYHDSSEFVEAGIPANQRYSGNVIVKMKPGYRGWTPYGCVRDCGDHYIKANYSSYDRIEKGTFVITKDVDDK